jgi:ATP-binding cassette subfamily C protein
MTILQIKVPQQLQDALGACRMHFALAAFFSALINVLYLAPTIYMMQVYDRVVPTGGILTLFWITIVVGLAIATLTALDTQRTRVLMRASLRINRLVSRKILDRLLGRNVIRPGEATGSQVMREFDAVRQALGGPAAAAFFDLPWTPLYLLVAVLIHPLLGVLVLIGGGLLIVLALRNERRTKVKAMAAHKANAIAYAFQEATARRAEAVRALGMRRALVALQTDGRRDGLAATADFQFASSRYNGWVKFARMFLQSLALGAGALLAVNGQISVGSIIAASVLLSRALQPIEQLVGQWPAIMQARQAIEMLDRLFKAPEGQEGPRTRLPDPKGFLELDRVVARDPQGTIVILKNVSLKMKPGEIMGVIGPSGAGKSTLARIAAGAIAPDFGEIRIDGARASDWDPDDLAEFFGYLPQQLDLLPGTIAENISRFALARGVCPTAVDREVIEAAQRAGVHNMILRLPAGYDTRVEENGMALSAGQAQRVALARALYGDPKILILDEPNSSLDSDGELALGRAVAAAKQHGAAIMIVAHRASILSSADTLLVLNEGAVAGYGPAKDVMEELVQHAARTNVVPIHEKA